MMTVTFSDMIQIGILIVGIIAEFRMKVRITKSEISTRTWCSLMSAASQGAFVLIPEISHSDISMHNKKIISLYYLI